MILFDLQITNWVIDEKESRLVFLGGQTKRVPVDLGRVEKFTFVSSLT